MSEPLKMQPDYGSKDTMNERIEKFREKYDKISKKIFDKFHLMNTKLGYIKTKKDK